MANTVAVDDRDSRITYTPNWFLAGGSDEFGSTTHGTRTAGARATFKFTGSSVAVYGTISDSGVYKDPPISTYGVDGASSVTYSATAGTKAQYKQRFFQSPKLADGEHTLLITSTVANAFFWVDYIEFTPAAEATPNPPPQGPVTVITTAKPETTLPTNPDLNTTTDLETTTNTSPTTGQNTSTAPNPNSTDAANQAGSGSSTNTRLDASQSPTNSAAPSVASGSKVPAGAIAGAAVGAVVILVLIAVILLLLRRQRRRGTNSAGTQLPALSTAVTPFMAGGPGSPSAMVQTGFVHGNLSHSSGSSPYPGAGHGYITHGGTSAEKIGMHRSQPSQSNSNVTSSSRGLLSAERETSEASSTSPYGGVSSSKSDSSAGAGPSQPLRQPVVGPSYAQSYGAGSLYLGYPDDTPPAYHQSPPIPHALQ